MWLELVMVLLLMLCMMFLSGFLLGVVSSMWVIFVECRCCERFFLLC